MTRSETRSFFDEGHYPDGVREVFGRSGISLSLADLAADDCPLVGVNQAFCSLSGYEPHQILGRNCRFLQPDPGPHAVRKRMRAFLADPEVEDGKFLVPNETRAGTPFLNLIYMSKIRCSGALKYVLASQFEVGRTGERERDIYDLALRTDLRTLNVLTRDDNWAVLGSFEALASSHSIIVRSKFDA